MSARPRFLSAPSPRPPTSESRRSTSTSRSASARPPVSPDDRQVYDERTLNRLALGLSGGSRSLGDGMIVLAKVVVGQGLDHLGMSNAQWTVGGLAVAVGVDQAPSSAGSIWSSAFLASPPASCSLASTLPSSQLFSGWSAGPNSVRTDLGPCRRGGGAKAARDRLTLVAADGAGAHPCRPADIRRLRPAPPAGKSGS